MSAKGALLAAIITLLLLGGFAAWLLNVPILAIAGFLTVASWLLSRLFRRFSRSRARQDTEAPR